MKPGWKTTEFWLNVGQQVVAALVVFGVIAPQNAQGIQEQVARDILALATLVLSTSAVIHYVQGRIHLKGQPRPAGERPGGGGPFLGAFVAGLALLGLAGPVVAAVTPPAGVRPCAWLPWRQQVEQRLKQLEQRQQAPTPPVIIQHHYQGTPPKQELPIQGAPRQDLPIPGAPRQDLPIPGAPKQDVPVPGVPRQDLPPQGAPKQDLPPGGPPMQKLGGPTRYSRYALYRR